MTGQNIIVPGEIYDTEPTSCTDDEIRYLAFDKRASDVYKRQDVFRDRQTFRIVPLQFQPFKWFIYRAYPVSYTHLDVYKRQLLLRW